MWYCWRKQTINRVDEVTNYQVLQKVNEQRTILDTTKTKRLQWSGLSLRHDCFMQIVLEVTEPKKARGRPWANLV